MTRINEFYKINSIKLTQNNTSSNDFKSICHPDGKNYTFINNFADEKHKSIKIYE